MQAPTGLDWRIELTSEAQTAELAKDIASFVGAGDVITLSGGLGGGKTNFARALIRFLLDDPGHEVPSPTFSLMQIYSAPTYTIVHADLYRIKDAEELTELGWDEETENALVLIEWAERIHTRLPEDRLDIHFEVDPQRGENFRFCRIQGHGKFKQRVAMAGALKRLLDQSHFADAKRSFMLGDASTRAYERLEKPDGQKAILMISPPRPDGPPVRYGKPYSAIAKLAETITPFIAIDEGLRAKSFSAPEIYAYDAKAGLAILEDLGSETIVDENGPIEERYAEASAALAHLHSLELPETIHLNQGPSYSIPDYDMDALLIEVELLTQWYVPYYLKLSLSSSAQATFLSLWKSCLEDILQGEKTWALRDYHSPNIIWLNQRSGIERIGMIDFQDCVRGHPAYDVASLLQDARVTVSDEMEIRLLGHYTRLRQAKDPNFDVADFTKAYAVLGAQRATKILGIFTRLDRRDGKPQYLAHMPRIEHYVRKCFLHPAMADVRKWVSEHLGSLLEPKES